LAVLPFDLALTRPAREANAPSAGGIEGIDAASGG